MFHVMRRDSYLLCVTATLCEDERGREERKEVEGYKTRVERLKAFPDGCAIRQVWPLG